MTDRVQPGAKGSITRNIEVGEAVGQYADGWIVPGDEPTRSAQRYADIDDGALAAFDAVHDGASLSVDIQPGEAFVDGWLVRDVVTTIDLEPDTAGQDVAIGWNPDAVYDEGLHATRDEADQAIVDVATEVAADVPQVGIWRFDTDANGVTNAVDLRHLGPALQAESILVLPKYATLDDVPPPEARPTASVYWIEAEDEAYVENGE